MTKEKQISFARRVSQANKTELVVITYDIILENVDTAEKYLAEEKTEEFRSEMKQAQKFLAELMWALDYRYSISRNLLQLYSYVQRILIASEHSGADRGLDSVRRVVSGLKAAFEEISPQDDSGAVMENSQKIFAGLTYGRDSLTETDMSANGTKRGFLA